MFDRCCINPERMRDGMRMDCIYCLARLLQDIGLVCLQPAASRNEFPSKRCFIFRDNTSAECVIPLANFATKRMTH